MRRVCAAVLVVLVGLAWAPALAQSPDFLRVLQVLEELITKGKEMWDTATRARDALDSFIEHLSSFASNGSRLEDFEDLLEKAPPDGDLEERHEQLLNLAHAIRGIELPRPPRSETLPSRDDRATCDTWEQLMGQLDRYEQDYQAYVDRLERGERTLSKAIEAYHEYEQRLETLNGILARLCSEGAVPNALAASLGWQNFCSKLTDGVYAGAEATSAVSALQTKEGEVSSALSKARVDLLNLSSKMDIIRRWPPCEPSKNPDLDAALDVVDETNRDAAEDTQRRQEARDSMAGEGGPGEAPGSSEPTAPPFPEAPAEAPRPPQEVPTNTESPMDVGRCNGLMRANCNALRSAREFYPEIYACWRAKLPSGFDPCTFDCALGRNGEAILQGWIDNEASCASPSPSPGNDEGSCRLSYEYLVVPQGTSEIRAQQMVLTGAGYGGGREGVEKQRREGISFYQRCQDLWPRRSYPSEQAWQAYLQAQRERCRRIVDNLSKASVQCESSPQAPGQRPSAGQPDQAQPNAAQPYCVWSDAASPRFGGCWCYGVRADGSFDDGVRVADDDERCK